jgi:hypothetical protein
MGAQPSEFSGVLQGIFHPLDQPTREFSQKASGFRETPTPVGIEPKSNIRSERSLQDRLPFSLKVTPALEFECAGPPRVKSREVLTKVH